MWRMDLSLETTITSLDSGLFYLPIRFTDWDASTVSAPLLTVTHR